MEIYLQLNFYSIKISTSTNSNITNNNKPKKFDEPLMRVPKRRRLVDGCRYFLMFPSDRFLSAEGLQEQWEEGQRPCGPGPAGLPESPHSCSALCSPLPQGWDQVKDAGLYSCRVPLPGLCRPQQPMWRGTWVWSSALMQLIQVLSGVREKLPSALSKTSSGLSKPSKHSTAKQICTKRLKCTSLSFQASLIHGLFF